MTEVRKVTISEIKYLEGSDTRVYLSDGSQLIGVTEVSTKVSLNTKNPGDTKSTYTIVGTIHNFSNQE